MFTRRRILPLAAGVLAASALGVQAQDVFPSIVGPTGMPAPVVEKLDTAIRAALAKPEVRARFAALTTAVLPLSTGELVQRIRSDNPKWEALMKKAGIEPQ